MVKLAYCWWERAANFYNWAVPSQLDPTSAPPPIAIHDYPPNFSSSLREQCQPLEDLGVMKEFSSADIPAGIAIDAALRANLPVDASQRVEAKGTVPGDVTTFKRLLDSCIELFQSLIKDLLQESNLSDYYFLPIIRRIDDELVRLEIWASDIGVEDPKFGRSNKSATSKLEVTVYMIGILESIIARFR